MRRYLRFLVRAHDLPHCCVAQHTLPTAYGLLVLYHHTGSHLPFAYTVGLLRRYACPGLTYTYGCDAAHIRIRLLIQFVTLCLQFTTRPLPYVFPGSVACYALWTVSAIRARWITYARTPAVAALLFYGSAVVRPFLYGYVYTFAVYRVTTNHYRVRAPGRYHLDPVRLRCRYTTYTAATDKLPRITVRCALRTF